MRQPELPLKTRKVWVLGLVSILVITTIKSANVAAVESSTAKPKYPQCTLENVEKLRERHECLTSVGMKGCFQALGGETALIGGTLLTAGAFLSRSKKSQDSLAKVQAETEKLSKDLDAAKAKRDSAQRILDELFGKLEKAPVAQKNNLASQIIQAKNNVAKAERARDKASENKRIHEEKTFLNAPRSSHGRKVTDALREYKRAIEGLKYAPMSHDSNYEIGALNRRVDYFRAELDSAHEDYLRVNKIRQARKRRFGGVAGVLGAGILAYEGIGPDPDPIPPNCRKDHAEDLKGITNWVRLDDKCKLEITQAGLIDLNLRTQQELTDLCTQQPSLALTLSQFQEHTDRVLKGISPTISDLDCQKGKTTFTTTLDGKPYRTSLTFDGSFWTLGGSFMSGAPLSNPLESFSIKLDKGLQGGVFKSANPQFGLYNSDMMTMAHFLNQYTERGYPKTHIGPDSNNTPTGLSHLLEDSVARQFLAAKNSLPAVQKVCSEALEEVASSSSAGGGTPTSPTAK